MKRLHGVLVDGVVLFTLAFGVGLCPAADKLDAGGKSGSGDGFELQKQTVAAMIEKFDSRVAKKLQEIDALTGSVDFRQFTTGKMAAEKMREVLSDLDVEAEAILQAYAALGPDLKLLRQAIESAPPVFTRIADDYEQKSQDAKAAVIKESYGDFSAQARNLALSYSKRVKDIDGIEMELAQKLEFVKESREFLHDAQELLGVIPSHGGEAIEKLLTRIDLYVKSFEKSLKTMRGVVTKIADPKSATAPATESPSTSSTSRVGEYRERLARLGK